MVPVEVWYRILKFLDPTELCAVKTVCHDWTHYILSDAPWIEHMKCQFGTRYEKARFLLDPTLTSKDRFWRASKLHQNWVSGERVSETLGGVLGYIRQIRLEGSVMALNLGDKIKAFDMDVSKSIWQSHEDFTAYHRLTSFDLWKNLVVFPGTSDQTVLNVVDYRTGKQQLQIKTGQNMSVVRVSKATGVLASGGRKIQVWDPERTKEPLLTLQEQHRGVVNCLELERNLITACHKGKKVRVWDIRSGDRVLTLSGHLHLIHCLALNDSFIASGSKDSTLRLWDKRRIESCFSLEGHTSPIRTLAMDDWKIVSGGREHSVMVWDIAKQERLYKIHAAENTQSLAFHETSLFVGGNSLVRHDFTPKKEGKHHDSFECSLS